MFSYSTGLLIFFVFLLIFLIFLSGYFSGCEIAFSSLKKEKFNLYKKNKKGFLIKSMEILMNNFSMTLSTVIIGNNLVNIGATTLSTLLFTKLFENFGLGNDESLILGVTTGVMTLLVILFGEYIPKNFAKKNPLKFSLMFCSSLIFIYYLFWPISFIFNILFNTKKREQVTEQEISHLIDIAEDDNIFENSEAELIKNAMNFDEKKVASIMKKNIISININDDPTKIIEIFLSTRYTRIPVLEKNKVIGILNLKQFFAKYFENKNWDFGIKDLLDFALFIDKDEKLDDLLKKMKIIKKHMAIVLEKNKIIGLITLEDLLEELVGEIYDEQDVIISDVQNLHTNSWIVNPKTNAYLFFQEHFSNLNNVSWNKKWTISDYVRKEFKIKKIIHNKSYENDFLKIEIIKNAENKKTLIEIIKK